MRWGGGEGRERVRRELEMERLKCVGVEVVQGSVSLWYFNGRCVECAAAGLRPEA